MHKSNINLHKMHKLNQYSGIFSYQTVSQFVHIIYTSHPAMTYTTYKQWMTGATITARLRLWGYLHPQYFVGPHSVAHNYQGWIKVLGALGPKYFVGLIVWLITITAGLRLWGPYTQNILWGPITWFTTSSAGLKIKCNVFYMVK